MSYIDKSLAPNESIIRRGAWPVMYWVAAWLALILLGWLVVGVLIFIRAAIHMNATQFAVTDRRVVLKRGWLNVHTQELTTESVESVRLDQTLWGKLFGYGRVRVTGTGDADIEFPPMAHPIAFRRAIEESRSSMHEVHLADHDPHPANEGKAEEDEAEQDRAEQDRAEQDRAEQHRAKLDEKRRARR